MRHIIFAAVLAAFAGFVHADPDLLKGSNDHNGTAAAGKLLGSTRKKVDGTITNSTHFVDQGSGKVFQHFDCDVNMSKATTHFSNHLAKLHNADKAGAKGTRAARALLQHEGRATANLPAIDTYFHVVTTKADQGTITQAMVLNQFNALNTAYNPVGISFKLKGADFTVNDAWAVGNGNDMSAMKTALRKGTYAALNVYFQSELAGGILGTCSLPSQVSAGMPPSMYNSDGCSINANTMPGGNIYGYNSGMTSVHEVGHWLGLLHTFEGYSCSGDGDSVADTPQEQTSTDGCPTSPAKNTCSNRAGTDPIHNYMDYSTDACYQAFSNGQVARIQAMWTQFRNGM